MDLSNASKKVIGAEGEKAAARYLERLGLRIVARNIARKTGEVDLLMRKGSVLHFIEVKTLSCTELPGQDSVGHGYDPSANLHEAKVRRVARTAEWIVAEREWDGEWQVDGALVWLRLRDGASRITYLPQLI